LLSPASSLSSFQCFCLSKLYPTFSNVAAQNQSSSKLIIYGHFMYIAVNRLVRSSLKFVQCLGPPNIPLKQIAVYPAACAYIHTYIHVCTFISSMLYMYCYIFLLKCTVYDCVPWSMCEIKINLIRNVFLFFLQNTPANGTNGLSSSCKSSESITRRDYLGNSTSEEQSRSPHNGSLREVTEEGHHEPVGSTNKHAVVNDLHRRQLLPNRSEVRRSIEQRRTPADVRRNSSAPILQSQTSRLPFVSDLRRSSTSPRPDNVTD